jgi:uncharacterized protein
MGRYTIVLLFVCIVLLIDFYVYQGVIALTVHLKPVTRESIHWAYWSLTGLFVVPFLASIFLAVGFQSVFFRRIFLPFFFINYTTKLFVAFFLLLDDMMRALKWLFRQVVHASDSSLPTATGIFRSTGLMKTAMAAAVVPVLTMGYGIIAGAHDYRVRRVRVRLPHLPRSFHGLRIGHLSDIHCGSFFNKTAVRRGIAMLLREKSDIIFFTGDLVNNTADEVNAYIDVFNKIQAPLGVYSILGNHDYGDYVRWISLDVKKKNHDAMRAIHLQLGWQLLVNDHKIITQGNDQLAVIGVENWGTGGFAKYGQLDHAYHGTENIPVKLLLSHDPSHWDAQVRPHYPDIDITFSGHTHGGQFGIEVGSFKWSPVQYRYKQWAGLYQEGRQYLYVNRGYGYIGYPGRIGIVPEITIMELEKA